jgi:PAP2 superfamily
VRRRLRARLAWGACVTLATLTAVFAPSRSHAVAASLAPPAQWRTWVLSAPDELRLGAPPAAGSVKTKRELRELLHLQEQRTARTRRQIRFWSGAPATVHWTELGLEMIQFHRPGAFPTRSARALALLHIGMYDAMVAAWDSRLAYERPRPYEVDSRLDPVFEEDGSSYADPTSAIAGAAEKILAYLFPQEAPETFTQMADRATASRLWAGVNYRSDVVRGRRLGWRVAEQVIARAEADGHKTPWDFESERLCKPKNCSSPRQQHWVPTPLFYQYPPTDPMASKWRTWLLESPSQFLPPEPPKYGSDQFMADLAELKAANDTADLSQRAIAFFWDDGPGTFSPAGHWNEIALDLVQAHGLETPATARLFALMNAAIMDAFVATWDAKYHYWTIRPVTVIRERPTIGGRANPLYDPGWLPNLVTPPFPAYPSGHSGESAAAARVLQYLFPDDPDQPPGDIAGELGPTGSIDEIAEEVALSRMIGGIHLRADNEAALILGRRIAALAIARAQTDGSGL